jgi:hypothetical protein
MSMFISDIQTTKRLWSNEQQQRDQTIKTAVSGKHKHTQQERYFKRPDFRHF